ncbi:MAG: hypothetical protein CL912_27830 [Deltaproteobacteria bacterium]|nr:hypothetical protein [Deltaproteobacteria bacterium]
MEHSILGLLNLDPEIGNALWASTAPMFDRGSALQSHALDTGQHGSSRNNDTEQGRLVKHIDMYKFMKLTTIYFTGHTKSLSKKVDSRRGIARHYIDVGARIEQDCISYSDMWSMKFSTFLDIGYGEFI